MKQVACLQTWDAAWFELLMGVINAFSISFIYVLVNVLKVVMLECSHWIDKSNPKVVLNFCSKAFPIHSWWVGWKVEFNNIQQSVCKARAPHISLWYGITWTFLNIYSVVTLYISSITFQHIMDSKGSTYIWRIFQRIFQQKIPVPFLWELITFQNTIQMGQIGSMMTIIFHSEQTGHIIPMSLSMSLFSFLVLYNFGWKKIFHLADILGFLQYAP